MTRRYDRERDEAEVKAWCKAHGRPLPRSLPSVGFIVDGLAAVFAIPFSDDAAFLEPGVTNPDGGLVARTQALRDCIKAAESWAADTGHSTLFALTDRGGIGRLLRRTGWCFSSGLLFSKGVR